MILLLIASLLGLVSSPVLQEDNYIQSHDINVKNEISYTDFSYTYYYYNAYGIFCDANYSNYVVSSLYGDKSSWWNDPVVNTVTTYSSYTTCFVANSGDFDYSSFYIPPTAKAFNYIEVRCTDKGTFALNNIKYQRFRFSLYNQVDEHSAPVYINKYFDYTVVLGDYSVNSSGVMVFVDQTYGGDVIQVPVQLEVYHSNPFYNLWSDVSAGQYNEIWSKGFSSGKNEGYQEGYTAAVNDLDYDSTALTITTGIIDVALLPVNVFLSILNFEVFGVNISGFVSAILTISIVIIIIRFLFGSKND